MDIDAEEKPIYTLPERYYPGATAVSTDYRQQFYGTSIPIVIDNGSCQFRAGWATESRPRLVYDNLVSKYRDRKLNTSIIAVGNDINLDQGARTSSKSAFDGNVVCNFELMEYVLDYTFAKLKIDTEEVDHPILITEPACMPHYSRKLMSELLFEGYGIPSVVYGIDALFSFNANKHSFDEGGIVISSGHTATHVIPVLGGKGILEESKRISYAGTQATDYMLKLMQLKYPTFPTKMTAAQAQQIMHNHTYVSENYIEQLRSFSDRNVLAQEDHVIQFPFTPPAIEEKTEEDLARQAAKREENSRRLREAAAKSRLEKLIARERELETYQAIKNAKTMEKKADWMARLKSYDFKTEAELDETIQKLESAIRKARNKELGIDEEEEKEEPTFPLLDISDENLSEAERREKKKQRLLKAGYDARMRAKKAKDEEKARQEELARKDEERRLADPAKWLQEIKEKRLAVVERIKSRRRRATQLADRRSHASQMRMRSIASLASDTPTNKRRRRGQEEDTFGKDDEDWMVYREIAGDDESDGEEEDIGLLNTYESLLLTHDPSFLPEHSFEAEQQPQNSLLHVFTRGQYPVWDPTDMAQLNQLHVNVERIRVPEGLFQPGILGLDQAGIIETLGDVLKRFDEVQRKKLLKTIFLTGGFTQLPGLHNRLHKELQSITPAGTDIHIHQAHDPMLDAWVGAAKWASQDASGEFNRAAVTRNEYEEMGGEYIKEHRFSNVFRMG